MKNRHSSSLAEPWYREPWPWLLIAGPLAVVLASIVTLALAVKSDDGVVAGDYYKRGLLVNQQLPKSSAPAVKATTHVGFRGDRMIVVALGGDSTVDTLRVILVHPASGIRQQVTLMQDMNGAYSGAVPPGPAGAWTVSFESSTLPTTLITRE